jgi:hypothetical protein
MLLGTVPGSLIQPAIVSAPENTLEMYLDRCCVISVLTHTFLMLIKCHLQQALEGISCVHNLWIVGPQKSKIMTQIYKYKTIRG